MGLATDKDGNVMQALAPSAIVTASAGVPLDVSGYTAVGAPVAFEFYINTASSDKITYPEGGTIPINLREGVNTLTFTAETVLVVM